jgi:hypothetical protein
MKVGAVGTQPTKLPDVDFVVMAENNENSPSGFNNLTYKRINYFEIFLEKYFEN